jgi:hypothetical protein
VSTEETHAAAFAAFAAGATPILCAAVTEFRLQCGFNAAGQFYVGVAVYSRGRSAGSALAVPSWDLAADVVLFATEAGPNVAWHALEKLKEGT